jgi:hypothetical protein
MIKKLDDKAIINAFVAHRRTTDMTDVQVDRYPRDSSDIDAIAGSLAIEHTSVDMVVNQRRDGAWFSRVVEPVERQVGSQITFRLTVVFPYEGVAKG